MALLFVWAWIHARLYVRHLGWAAGEGAVFFRSGWLWRELTVARFNKMQAVSLGESPFDRRARMASIRVDTAGAGNTSHRVNIPYLARAHRRRALSPALWRSGTHGVPVVSADPWETGCG